MATTFKFYHDAALTQDVDPRGIRAEPRPTRTAKREHGDVRPHHDFLFAVREAQLAGFVFVDLETGDLLGYIEKANAALSAAGLPAGISWHWAGTYEALQRASERLQIAVPLTLVITFALLLAAFRRAAEAWIVMLSLPLTLVGGLWLLWALDYAFSVAVAVGFIALVGVGVEFGVVMLTYLRSAVQRRREQGQLIDEATLDEALREGALQRIRPKLMTVATIFAGLLPIMLADGAGAATMQRIAAPMLGGMFSAPLLSLLLIPALYKMMLLRELRQPPGAVS